MAGIWPTTLPQAPELSSFTDKAPNNLIRSDMDKGLAAAFKAQGECLHSPPVRRLLVEREVAHFSLFNALPLV